MRNAVLCLDLGTKLGWAIRHADGHIESGMQHFKLGRGPWAEGERFRDFRAWLHDQKRRVEYAEQHLAQVRFERVDFVPEERTGAFALHTWGAFWGILTGWCAHHNIPHHGFAVSTLKKQATGNGRASKDDVKAAVKRRLELSVHDDNEADAIALLLCEVRA